MTKESALLVPVAGIIGAVILGVGFSTGIFRPEPLSSDGRVRGDPAAVVSKATPKDAPSLVTQAQEYMALGEYAKAIVFLRAATRLTPKDYSAQKMLAAAAFQNNDMVLAANACETAVRLNPEDADAQLGLAKALYALNRMSDAAATCRALLVSPSSSSAQRQAAEKILDSIPLAVQKREPEAIFPIISAD